MGEVEMLARFRIHKFRLHKFEAFNNIGYMLVTLATSHSLLSSSFFQGLLGSVPLFRPTVMMATVCLMVYLLLRLMGLTREPMMSMFLTNVRGNVALED
jgi:hypothetical protein